MALDQKFFKKSTAAAGTADQEQGLFIYADANDVDSYDGDGSIWYDISSHDVNVPLADKASNLQFELNFSKTSSYPGYGTTFTDVSGNNITITPGTNSSATYTYGQDLGGYINIQAQSTNETWTIPHSNDTHLSSTNGFTYEYWLYFDTAGNDTHQFYLKGTGDSNYDTYFYLHESAGWYFQVGGISSHFIHNADKLLDQWVHVVFTMSTPTNPVQKLYINGSLVKTSTASGTVSNTSSYNTNIGSVLGNNNDIYGRIGCVRLYNTLLSSVEVGQNFRHGRNLSYSSIITSKDSATQSSLVTVPPTQGTLHTSNLGFHLDANGHSGTYWTDSANNINGTINGATYVNDNNSDYFTFDGNNDTVTFPASDTSPINFSSETHAIEFWVNFNTLANDDVILGKFGGSNTTKSFQIQVSSTNKLTILERDGSSNNTFETTGTFSTGTWTHFIYARSASQVILYINGALDSTHSASNAINAGSTQDITIGNQAGASVYFDGKLAQLRIYSSTLNSSQVLTNYNATKDLYQGVTSLQLSLDANGYTSGAWSDSSGNSRNGTITSAAHTNDNNSDYFTFTGATGSSGDKVVVTHTTDLEANQDFSIEMWVWRNDDTNHSLISKGTGSASWDICFGASTNFGYQFNNYSGEARARTGTGDFTSANRWEHIVVTYDDGTKKPDFFIDGVLRVSHTHQAGTQTPSGNSADLIIGGYYSYPARHGWNGRIAQVRFYKGKLTQAQVNANYNATKALYQNPTIEMNLLGSAYTSGATWSDSSGKGNNGSISGTPNYDQELGDYLNFSPGQASGSSTSSDVSTTRLTVSSFSALQTATAFTIELWLKSSTASSDGMIWNVYDSSSSTRKFSLSWNNSKFRWVVYSASGGYNASQDLFSTNTFSTNIWYHVVATYNYDTEMKIYIDGILEGAETSPNLGVNTTTTTQMRIGDRSDGYAVDTQVGQARFYTGTLTQAQVVQNYLATKNKYPNSNNFTLYSPDFKNSSTPYYFRFNAANDEARVSSVNIDVSMGFTVSIYIKRHTSVSGYQQPFRITGTGHPSYLFMIAGLNDTVYYYTAGPSGTNDFNSYGSSGSWSDNSGAWRNVIFTRENTPGSSTNRGEVYVNGSSNHEQTNLPEITNITNIYVNRDASYPTSRNAQCDVGLIKIWKKPFSDAEALAEYNATKDIYGL